MISSKMYDMKTRTTLHLTDYQRTHLDSLIRSGSAKARTQTRARILLLTDRSQGGHRSDQEVADALMVSKATIRRIRQRFVKEGMESALDEKPRPGHAPKITGDIEAQIIALACSDAPEGHANWTLRLLADKVVELGCVDSLSHTAVADRLKKTRSSPGKSSRGALQSRLPGSSRKWKTCSQSTSGPMTHSGH
jgi:putative transposase